MVARGRGAEASSRPLERGNPLLGYTIVIVATALGGINASVGKVVMVSGGLPPNRLAEFRATASALILIAGIALLSRGRFTPRRRDLPFIFFFGIFGLALGQYTYFLSIERLDVGVALLVVNLAIVLVAVWGRLSGHEHVGRRLWLAIFLALAGLALMVELTEGFVLDPVGVAAALACALTYAVYVVMADRSAREERPAWFLVGWGFVFAALFWVVVQPWWGFPFEILSSDVSLLGRLEERSAPVWALLGYVVPFGTVGTFVMYAAALRYIPPTHVVVVALLEPVFGTLVAFGWLGETLSSLQLVGGGLVIAAVLLGQSARSPDEPHEIEPEAIPPIEPHADTPSA
ncbi:MAG: DMT family transporter [Actinobacteria bacterium]|nr:DMT family transporter [Actinomycetota bacterium]